MTTYTLWIGNGYIEASRNTAQGVEDAHTCAAIIGNHCYIQYHGGQMEQVLDDAVAISYFDTVESAKGAVEALREDGIKGTIGLSCEEREGEMIEIAVFTAPICA